MKQLVLFDIDGTILSTNGAARRAFHAGLLDVYGTAGPIDTHRFDGKTDPQIARELLSAAGLPDAEIDNGLELLWGRYLANLEIELATPGIGTVYPGVRELLATLREMKSEVILALLTGNIARGAGLKLGSVGLHDHFSFGAYGSDAERRDALPAIAVDRARELTGAGFTGRQVVIIGDTPYDVTCGRSLGVRAIGVCTGHYGAAELEAAGADTVFQDFSATADVLECILAPRN